MSHDLTDTTCSSTDLDLALVDGRSATCLSVNNTVHRISVTINETHSENTTKETVYISVTTRYMDCSLPFHVRVSHRKEGCYAPESCDLRHNRKQDGGMSTCRFGCRNGGGWVIRVANIGYGEICDVILETWHKIICCIFCYVHFNFIKRSNV